MSKFKPYYVYRFLKWRLGDRSPLSAVLKVTSRCNLTCVHCPWEKQNGKDLSKKRWFKIIDESRKKGCILCIIEGGEPLLREDLEEIVTYAKDSGMLVSVITNGTIDFSGVNPHAFWVSIDGGEKTHDSIRGKGSFKKIMKNLKKNKNKNILSLTTISSRNFKDIKSICRDVHPAVNGMWFNFLYPYEGKKELSLSREEKIGASREISELKKKYNIINSESFLSSVRKGWECRPWITLNVNSSGEFHHGCTVEQQEKCDCSLCDMSCYGELSQAYKMKLDAVDFLKKSLGLKSCKFIFLKH